MSRRGSRRQTWAVVGMLAAAPAVAVFGPSPEAWATQSAVDQAATTQRHPRENTLMKRQWGVEVEYVRESANGYMLEFRYKVIDAEKAAPLFERRTKPLLIHERTGASFIVPTPGKVGALRNSNAPLEDHVYWMFFANPGRFVKPGDRVTIEIGAFRAEGLVVE